jgi:spore coat polysaccharide biosynthesis protein SpsF (cytidylyltransferase family)
MNFLTTVEARYDSTRLPGKVLSKLDKKTLVFDLLFKNIKKSKYVKKILIATSINKNNKKISAYAKKNNYLIYNGSELNVLERLNEATKVHKEKYIIQLTADNPLIDFEVINYVVEQFIKYYPKYDFVTNNNLFSKRKYYFPAGMIVSVFKKKLLKKAHMYQMKKKLLDLAEHPSLYFYREARKEKKIKCLNVIVPIKWRFKLPIRLTLDHKKDLYVIRKIFNFQKSEQVFGIHNIYNFLLKNEKVRKYNLKIIQKIPNV